MKTFRQLIVENEKEHLLWVKSTQNIHTPEKLELIKLAALSHDCVGVEPDYHKVVEKTNKDFPDLPNTESYAVKVYLGLETCPAVFRQELLMRLGIKAAHVKVTADGHECEQCKVPAEKGTTTPSNFTPVEQPDMGADAQSLVGVKRIDTFLKSLEKARKERESAAPKAEVSESYMVPYQAIQKATGEPTRKGFWLVEHTAEGIVYDGPFAKLPEGIPYKEEISE